MNLLKALVPLGFLILAGTILNRVVAMDVRGYSGVLWTLGAFLSVSFVALALYSIKKFFGEKDDDNDGSDHGQSDGSDRL